MGDTFYVIESGKVDVEIDSVVQRTMQSGDYFGEIALIMGSPSAATMIACELTVL